MCFWHAGNLSPDPNLRALMHELATEDRISVVVLGNAVQKTMQFKVDDWSEKFEDSAWERMPLELFVPVSIFRVIFRVKGEEEMAMALGLDADNRQERQARQQRCGLSTIYHTGRKGFRPSAG